MNTTQQILNKIFKNPEQDLLMFDDLSKIDIYEKDEKEAISFLEK